MEAIKQIETKQRKPAVSDIRPGDTVRVHQLIREGNKQRVQVFEGVVIRTRRPNELSACVTVRRIASGVGVEKTFLLHSPNVTKIEVIRRAKVRRNFLSYLRGRRGKSARLTEVSFDRAAANVDPAKQIAEVPADENIDAEITELNQEMEEQIVPDESTDQEVKTENKAAAAADAEADEGGADENELPAEEANAGVDRAEKDS